MKSYRLIDSKMLNETIAICLTEDVAKQVELNRKHVAYTEDEIKILSELSKTMDEKDWQVYGKKIHAAKKGFPGSRVVDIIKNNPPPPKTEARQSEDDLRVEGAEQPVASNKLSEEVASIMIQSIERAREVGGAQMEEEAMQSPIPEPKQTSPWEI